MTEYVLVYRINDELDGCRYLELNDGKIHFDINGKPIVTNANCFTRVNEEREEVETWLTTDVFNRMKDTDGTDTFTDVEDMIANGEHNNFEQYIRESEKLKIMETYDIINEDEVEEIIEAYDGEYFDASIIRHVYEDAEELGKEYVEMMISGDMEWLENYLRYNDIGEDIIDDDYNMYFRLLDNRIVEYCY